MVLQVEKGAFTWESDGDSSTAYMQDINIDAKPGTLTMVVGSVASGKTSLLSALIGQMERLQGTVAVGGRVAYVAQTAWIVNDSVQVRLADVVAWFLSFGRMWQSWHAHSRGL